MAQEFKRLPAIEKRISEISDKDIRVSIRGVVIDSEERTVVVDDGSGKVKATFDEVQTDYPKIVRVIGRVIPFENGIEIQGEILQNMEKLDLDVFKKLTSIR